jgi:Cu-Zn family superoxide dismutase
MRIFFLNDFRQEVIAAQHSTGRIGAFQRMISKRSAIDHAKSECSAYMRREIQAQLRGAHALTSKMNRPFKKQGLYFFAGIAPGLRYNSDMRLHNILAMASSLVISFAFSAAAQGPVKVDLSDAQGKSVGTVELTAAPQGVSIHLNLKDLPPGDHAIHVHTVAKCEGPAFTTAGPHLNPDAKHHGLQNPEGPHAGDMPNFTVSADGTAKATVVAPGVTMGDDSHSVFTNGGTALVIHANADDMKSDPAGNAGARVACGAIVKK